MTGEQMWQAFAEAKGLPENTAYEAWAFGGSPDELAQLVLQGGKTGTSSAYPLYELEDEPLPEAGEYSVILDGHDEAVCVIETVCVTVIPYREITGDHARKEGEGDLSLAYWRQVHEAFFTEELQNAGLAFTQDMPVVFEEFQCIWPAPHPAPGVPEAIR